MKLNMKHGKNKFIVDNKVNKQLIITSLSILLTVVLVIGTSLAAFTWNNESSGNMEISGGSIGVSITNTDGTLTMENAYPKSNIDGINQSDSYSFTVSNTTNNPVYYSVKLESDSDAINVDGCQDNQIPLDYISWYIDGDSTNNVYPISYINEVVSEGYLGNGGTKTYKLKLFINNKATNDVVGKHFHGKLVLEYKQATNYTKLSDKIKEDNDLQTDTADFGKAAVSQEFYNTLGNKTNYIVQNGLYKDVDDDGDTYYFRGHVENNYVKLGEKLWRIVRINRDGTTRLMSNETVGQSAFNINSIDEKYVGYTYDNGTPSTIKAYLDNWYNENMVSSIDQNKNFDNLIASAKFCNDTSVTNTIGNIINYGIRSRIINNKKPSYKCFNTTKSYGGEYDSKIGLLNGDEASFAGGVWGITNTNYYLNKGKFYWLLSPGTFHSDNNGYEFYVNGDGYINNVDVKNTAGAVIPVINLKASIPFTTGDGTIGNPYVVKVGE